jgi:geranylgeranyl transferase type-2 subunit alpha
VNVGPLYDVSQCLLCWTVHAWNYRRYILANMPAQRPDKYELAYTTRKIESSMSNFSAWHQRSKVLSSLWDSGELVPSKSREEGE